MLQVKHEENWWVHVESGRGRRWAFTTTASVLGPVVQSVVSLTNSLRVISLTVFADSIYNILIFFQQKNSAYEYLRITRCEF